MKKITKGVLFLASILALSFVGGSKVFSQTRAVYCLKLGWTGAVGQCNASCLVYCPSGFQICNRNYNGAGAFGSCVVPDRACAWQLSDGTRRATGGACCCSVPTVTPTPYLCGRGNCSGCCMNNICYPGTATNSCGTGGNLCQACPSGRVCSNQTCVVAVTPTPIPYLCGRGNCSGCCVNNTCYSGTETNRCGIGGNLCQACPSGRVCLRNACAISVTPTPTVSLTSCQGQYFGKSQCDAKGLSTYGRGGTCQLNPALGTINPNNPNDPINYWKWSYCR